MERLETTQKDRMPSEGRGRLRELADQLSRYNDVEFEREGRKFNMRVPDEEELEIEDDGSELEIEVTWEPRWARIARGTPSTVTTPSHGWCGQRARPSPGGTQA
jgi:hypothetical protein